MRTRSSKKKVTYTVMRRGRDGSVLSSLEDFLAAAHANKWIILLNVKKLPPGPAIWCPFLQPTLLATGELAKQIKDTNCPYDFVVADVSDDALQAKMQDILAAESTFVNMQTLLRHEEAASAPPPTKKKRNKQPTTECTDTPLPMQEDMQTQSHEGHQQVELHHEEEASASPPLEQPLQTKKKKNKQPKMECTDAPQPMQEEGHDTHQEVELHHEEEASASPPLEQHFQTKKKMECTDAPQPMQEEIQTQSHEGHDTHQQGEPSATLQDIVVDQGRIKYKGKHMSTLEVMVELLQGQKNMQRTLSQVQRTQRTMETRLSQVQTKVTRVQTRVTRVQTRVTRVQETQRAIRKELKEMHQSVSAVAERVSRCSLALLYGQHMGEEVEYPVTTRWMPYDPITMETEALERLAALYAKPPEDIKKGDPSGFVEVDLLIKIRKPTSSCRTYLSPMTGKTSRLSAEKVSSFTHMVVGEYTRSYHLCASAEHYMHPENPCRTPSAKLLKKLVQVERGIVASLFYYDAAGDAALVDAAAIISPSFRQLSDPQSLLNEVLSHAQGTLPNVERLAKEQRMWLVDA